MGRVIFTIIMSLLYGGFSCFYSIDSFRASLIELVPQLETVYGAIDEFFIKVWKVIFESWVSIDYNAHPNLPGTIIVGLAILIIIFLVLLISSIIHSSNKNRKIRLEENIKSELEKLDSREVPSEFTHYDVNNVVFANEKTPLISLENELVISSKSQEENTQALLNAKKNSPLFRTIFSVLYCSILIFFIFLRIVYHHHYSAESSLNFLLQNETILFLFDNFDRFFDSLAGGLLGKPVFNLMEVTWYAQEVIEYLFVFIIGILFLVAVLLICHLILIKRRKRVNLKHNLNKIMTYEEGDISNKNLSFFGYADTRNVKGDVRTIAKLSNSEAKETREKSMYKRASYIDDISEGVDERGVLNLGGFIIEPTVKRKPLEYEPLEQDLSMNEKVTLDDIVSIDEKKDDVIVDKIQSLIVPDEGVNYVDPALIDVNVIAKTNSNSKPDKIIKDIDDTLVFDEDGYAYLVKEGKNFIDDEEDISDIIELDELDKTAIIDRFGENYYSLLNDLEPFHLHRLDFDEEMERNNNAKYNSQLVDETKKNYNELVKEEFVSQKSIQEEVNEQANKDISIDLFEDKREETPKIVSIYEEEPVEDVKSIKTVFNESDDTIEEANDVKPEKQILDPRRREERPTINPIEIKIKREKPLEKNEPKSSLPPKVELVKFRKPYKSTPLEKDIMPISLDTERMVNNSKLPSKIDSLKRPVNLVGPLNNSVKEDISSNKIFLDKPNVPLTFKKKDYSEEKDTLIDESFEDIFTIPELDTDRVKKVPLKRFIKQTKKSQRELTKKNRIPAQPEITSKSFNPVDIKKVDYSRFVKSDDENK